MAELTYTPEASPTIGSEAPEPEGSPSLLWFEGEGPTQKIDYLNRRAQELGRCYVRLLIFSNELARLPFVDFELAVERFVGTLKEYPLGHDIFVELPIMNNLGMTDSIVRRLNDGQVDSIYGDMIAGKARVKATRVENSDLFHIESLPFRPFCECVGPVCLHGWNFRMCMVALTMGGRRVGASHFNINEFLQEFDEGDRETTFQEAFSQLTPTPKGMGEVNDTVNRWKDTATKTTEPILSSVPEEPVRAFNSTKKHSRQNSRDLPRPLATKVSREEAEVNLIRNAKRMGTRLKALADLLELQADAKQREYFSGPTPPASPELQSAKLSGYEESLAPHDSSSVLGRYGKQFMKPGTILTVQPAGNEKDRLEDRTRLTVENHLIDGYQKTELIVQREAKSIQKLRPINGLPRPFTNTRLNFLCNLHTAMTLKLKKHSGSHLEAMYDAMRNKPSLPVESLLCQVLTTTIDRHEGTYTSNAFNLPYIEVGMQFTEESVVKMFDLLQLEYKRVWFQEMKNLIVPNFHGDYKEVSTGVLGSKLSKVLVEASGKERHGSRSRRGSRSVLGF